MKTIQYLENFIFNLNINCESPDDTEAFYDFCISSCNNDEYITKERFYEEFKNSEKQYTSNQIEDYFYRYEAYLDLLRYTVRNCSLQINKEKK